ncbi:MAG: N-acetylneuraminate synthase [Bacteriovoracaceae bacterium]|nr:N-acetylneuraminate synthase [Bacteriovoracaceae bacterium]
MRRNSSEHRAIFIAEAGINHDGSLEKARKMVDAAVEAGADYVKFQSFKAKKLVTHDALTSSYIDEGSHEGESFRDLLKRLELDEEAHKELKLYCDSKNIKFLSTAFDNESFDFLVSLGIDVVKIASGDLTNLPLIRHMAKSKLPIILSTGMATLGETEEAVNAILEQGNDQITLLHCISWYPAEISTTNLRYMETLRNAFPFDVGYSDHTLGINMSIAARALGATVIEKHFTLDKKEFGPDHAASIEPDEMKALIKGLREIEEGLGSTQRIFCEKELGQRKVHRRSVVVAKNITEGEEFSSDNLTIKRPGTGIKPKHFEDILGKKSRCNYKADELLRWGDVVE